ncbi:AMIN domain-containing protein [Desulfolutivibrio sulfodismutans DSM 3696]|nr:AMIN domain-containing protein [Desulfolutivibrio sulfodismutans DSM 3696]
MAQTASFHGRQTRAGDDHPRLQRPCAARPGRTRNANTAPGPDVGRDAPPGGIAANRPGPSRRDRRRRTARPGHGRPPGPGARRVPLPGGPDARSGQGTGFPGDRLPASPLRRGPDPGQNVFGHGPGGGRPQGRHREKARRDRPDAAAGPGRPAQGPGSGSAARNSRIPGRAAPKARPCREKTRQGQARRGGQARARPLQRRGRGRLGRGQARGIRPHRHHYVPRGRGDPDLHGRPPRLVIDLAGRWTYTGPLSLSGKSPLITLVRIGKHPDILRLVLDLAPEAVTRLREAPVVDRTPNGVVIRLPK